MRIEQVNESIIGRKVKGIENGYEVTGTIIGIVEDEYSKGVRIKLDEPLTCWSGDFNTESCTTTEYSSTGRKSDGWGNLELTEFTDGVESLADYQPKDRHITSWPEYKMICEKLHLLGATPEHVQKTRDEVVEFYDKLIEKAFEEGNREKGYGYSESLMSVTAVIDDIKWKMGMEV